MTVSKSMTSNHVYKNLKTRLVSYALDLNL